jgi:hypothetical protein
LVIGQAPFLFASHPRTCHAFQTGGGGLVDREIPVSCFSNSSAFQKIVGFSPAVLAAGLFA